MIYRFGKTENFYLGARYNKVTAEDSDANNWDADNYKEINISRFQLGAGWFMTDNILMKLEYVNQKHDDYNATSQFSDGKFKGLMVEAAISF